MFAIARTCRLLSNNVNTVEPIMTLKTGTIMRILVTGSTGFIGGHLAEQFLKDGHNVTVLDEMHPYYDLQIKEHTLDLHRSIADTEECDYAYVESDVRNSDLIDDLVKKADIVHQATRAGVRDSVAEPRVYDEVNVDGTLNILDAARETDIEGIVVASSSSVYGGCGKYVPFEETDPTPPVSPYGASELAAELYAAAYYGVYDISTIAAVFYGTVRGCDRIWLSRISSRGR